MFVGDLLYFKILDIEEELRVADFDGSNIDRDAHYH